MGKPFTTSRRVLAGISRTLVQEGVIIAGTAKKVLIHGFAGRKNLPPIHNGHPRTSS